MTDNAYDVQICLWKMLRLSSKTCVDASINHPYVSCSLFFSFILYVFFPLVFWILVYSTPLVVCSCVALIILRKPREVVEGNVKSDKNYNTRKETKFATERVHSVRRRRAVEIVREDEKKQNTLLQQDEITLENELATWHTLQQQDEIAREEETAKQNALLQQDETMRENELAKQDVLLQQDEQEEEEEKVISSTNCDDDCVDKTTLLVEEIPKEIREVEQVRSPPQTSLKNENEEETTNKDDRKNNVMDIGISDTERTKRLESLIARRRSRKMLNHLRSSLMNKNKNNDHTITQMANLVIPKIITHPPNKISGPFSPGPGSAPSVLIPMRNPFDLPYDPQEEKPVLTGDSFHQEFTLSNNYRDVMFTRHESFSLGPSLHARNRDATSSGRDFGFRRGGYRLSRTQYASPERNFSPIFEQKLFESKSSMNNQDDDQIKEVIQVDDENESENHSSESNGESESTQQIPQSDFNSSSSSPSSEEDPPLFKIDREAVLKSLSSMRRNALLEIENNEEALGDNLSYANSALENATQLKQQYYDDKPMRRHTISYSIASDMQVEVSEVSSPPLTIDENMNEDVSTCDCEILEMNDLSWDGDNSWANETNRRDATNDRVSRIETTDDESLSDTTTDHEQSFNEKCFQSELSDNDNDLWAPSDNETNIRDAINDQVSRIETTYDESLSDTTTDHEQLLNVKCVQSELSDNSNDLWVPSANETNRRDAINDQDSRIKITNDESLSDTTTDHEQPLNEKRVQSGLSDNGNDSWAPFDNETNIKDAINDQKSRIETTKHESLLDTTTDHEHLLNEKCVQYELSDNGALSEADDNEINRQDPINNGVSRIETTYITNRENPLDEKHHVQFELSDNSEDQGHIELEQHSSGDHPSINQPDVDSNDQQPQTSTISPKSVLISTLSLPNLNQDGTEQAHQPAPHTTESSISADASLEYVSDELKNQENVDQSEEVAISSIDHDEETSSRSIDAASTDTSEATSNQNAFDKRIDQSEMVVRESAHDDELKIQENDDQSEEVVVSSIDPDEETSSRSIDAKSANDSEATSNQNASSKGIDQPEDQVVIRESTHDDEKQTNSTSSNSFDVTKQVQDYDLPEPVEGNETNGADHREDEQNANSQGTILPENDNNIDNDNK